MCQSACVRAHVDCVRGSLCWYVLAAVSLRAQELCVVSHRAHQRVYSRANNATDVRAYRLMRRGLTKQIRTSCRRLAPSSSSIFHTSPTFHTFSDETNPHIRSRHSHTVLAPCPFNLHSLSHPHRPSPHTIPHR